MKNSNHIANIEGKSTPKWTTVTHYGEDKPQ